jgi:hypothetical protein
MALPWLEQNGYIRLEGETYRPTDNLLFNLGLSDIPPRKRRGR